MKIFYQGEKIILTSLIENDRLIFYKWINDPNLVTLSAPYKKISMQEHNLWFDNIQNKINTNIFAIRTIEDQALLGSCQLLNIHPLHRSAELQIRIGEKEKTNQGHGTESCQLLLKHGFTTLNLNRIGLHVFSDNKIAERVYKKVGFKEEGFLRQAVLINGKFKDIKLFSILADEYTNV